MQHNVYAPFAATFTTSASAAPICSLCVFSNVPAPPDLIQYLQEVTLPSLALLIPNSDASTVEKALDEGLRDAGAAVGIDCWGELTDFTLIVAPGRKMGR